MRTCRRVYRRAQGAHCLSRRGGGLHSPAGRHDRGRRNAGDCGGKRYRKTGSPRGAGSVAAVARRRGGSRRMVGSRRRPAATGRGALPERRGRARHSERGRAGRDPRPSILRGARRERPRLRDLPPALRRDGVVRRNRARALGRDGRAGPAVRKHRRPQLPASAGRRPRGAFVAPDPRPRARRVALAAARRERRGAARRVHARGRSRPDGLQHAPRARPRIAAAHGVCVPAAAAGRKHQVSDSFELRRRPVHREKRSAGCARSRYRFADEHEHDGRRAGDDAEGASRRRGAHAPRPHERAHGRCAARHRFVRGADLRRAGARRCGRRADAGPPGFGPRNLAAAPAGVLGNNTTRWVFPLGDAWREPEATERGSAAREGAPRSRAATTCSCSARFSSATRCT